MIPEPPCRGARRMVTTKPLSPIQTLRALALYLPASTMMALAIYHFVYG